MLSSRAKYATRALLDLSLQDGNTSVLIKHIAARQQIPLKFLQQILASLKDAGLLKSQKGPGGGYALARTPDEITLGQVIRAMDGIVAPISCASKFRYQECGCPNPDSCVLRECFVEVRDVIAEVFDNTTFANLRDRQRRLDADSAT